MPIEIPRNAREQLDIIFPYDDYRYVTHQELHMPLVALMKQEGIRLLASECRTKPLERVMEKLSRRGWDRPIPDIHAARLILGKTDFVAAREAIFSKWPTPEFVYPRLQSFRDYDDAKTRASYNTNSDQEYRATHLSIHVPFGARIAEVQLYTVADFAFNIRTRDEYLQKQRGH